MYTHERAKARTCYAAKIKASDFFPIFGAVSRRYKGKKAPYRPYGGLSDSVGINYGPSCNEKIREIFTPRVQWPTLPKNRICFRRP